jgi:DNA-binding transcriptional LysR family regulator
MNLDIDALRSFSAIAEQRNFTRAAERVSRTQSAVSMQIKKLETLLGFALFVRTKRSVALTPRGEQLLAYAQPILHLNDEGVRAVCQAPLEGRLRLGITEYFAPQWMPGILNAFRASHPTLDVQVTAGVTGYLRGLHGAGELDMVIGRRELGSTEGALIRREKLVWAASPTLQLRPREPVSLALLPLGCGIRNLVVETLEAKGRAWRLAYCGPSVLGLQAAVAAGLAVSCLTRSALLKGFRTLGSREGLPPLPDSELALFNSRARGRGTRVQTLGPLAQVVLDHFSSPAILADGVFGSS